MTSPFMKVLSSFDDQINSDHGRNEGLILSTSRFSQATFRSDCGPEQPSLPPAKLCPAFPESLFVDYFSNMIMILLQDHWHIAMKGTQTQTKTVQTGNMRQHGTTQGEPVSSESSTHLSLSLSLPLWSLRLPVCLSVCLSYRIYLIYPSKWFIPACFPQLTI